jgi:hypothetical protein
MKRFVTCFVAITLSSSVAAQDVMQQHDVQSGVGSNALAMLRLSTGLDGTAIFKSACGKQGDRSAALAEKEAVAALGYDLGAIPYFALKNPKVFCSCAVRVAARANVIASKKFGVSSAVKLPSQDELKDAQLLPGAVCKAGPWRVEFANDGLELKRNGVTVLGGSQQLVGGKTVERRESRSFSWVE